MSESDSFIDEVAEEIRRDRLFRLMRKYGWIPVVLVLAIVGGTAFNEWREARARAEAQERGDAILSALATEDAAARAEALAGIGEEGAPGGVVGLLSADAALEAGETARAAERLAAVAANDALAPAYRALARLKRARLPGPDRDRAERLAALEDLAAPGAPFRLLALEAQAHLHAGAGEREAALDRLNRLLEAPQATPGLRRRATQLMVALGGTPEAS